MGVGIAFPRKLYSLRNSEIVRVADEKKWFFPKKSFLHRLFLLILSKLNTVILLLHIRYSRITKILAEDDNSAANRKYNTQVMLHLECSDTPKKEFVVATYHMPCEFRRPRLMVIHAALAAQAVQRFAEKKPIVWCGDYNFKPTDAAYELVTKGSLAEGHPHHVKRALPPEDNWHMEVEPFRSAYVVARGKEPAYTNCTINKLSSGPFVGTLDYIFLSHHWDVASVDILPEHYKEEDFCPLPTLEQPSDHLAVAAELLL